MLLLVRKRLDHRNGALDHRADVQRFLLELDLARFDFRELEQVFENQIEPVALLQNNVEKAHARLRVILAAVQAALPHIP